MAIYYIDENVSLPASADLSTNINVFVKINSDGQIAVVDGSAAANPVVPVGVLLDKPNAQGVHGNVQTRGIAKVKAGAATTKGEQLMVDAAGKVINYVDPGAGKSVFTVGQGLNAAGAANELVEVLLNIVRNDNAA